MILASSFHDINVDVQKKKKKKKKRLSLQFSPSKNRVNITSISCTEVAL